VLVKYGHVLVGVRIGPEWVAVDFDGRAGDPRRFRVISDLEAIADFYNNLGTELAWSGGERGGFGAQETIRAFELAARIDPGFSRAWNNLGVALGRAGRLGEAIRAYRRALRADRDFPAPYANLGQIHQRRGDIPAALVAFEHAVRLAPKNPHYRCFLGKALAVAGRADEALDHLLAGERAASEVFQIHMQMALIHARQGDRDRAEQAARRVLELVPGPRDATRMIRRIRGRD